ncbi:MAG: hypothetical protein CVT99_01725 [Bacteroidetes bacterium HGW-Bacteroidetes-16]|jgi:hypothetical protein|nr:MAG: hypothetical protein CVT99_01725 [Bacteroidetes bacterium HGW-Bacteroidetes-16]
MNTRSFGFLVLFIMLFGSMGFSQVISENAKRKITIGFDMFTDLLQNIPYNMDVRTIHQGANIYGMYNFQIGKGNSSFGIGLGIGNHNIYSHSKIDDIKADTIVFSPIKESFKRSKINLTYLELPMELKIRFKNEMKMGVGFKIGYLLSSKEKYVGDTPEQATRVTIKTKTISQTQDYAYGFTLRVGYKSVNLFGYYQISQIFNKGRGPELYPISVGITLTPF